MFRSRVPALLLATTVAIGSIAMGGQSSADVQVRHDGTRDVAKFRQGCDVLTEDCASPDRRNKTADITRVRSEYRKDALILSTSLRRFPGKGQGEVLVTWDIKYPNRGYKVAGVTVRNGRLADDGYIGSACILSNAKPSLVRSKHLVRMSIPAKCFEGARWVRTATGTHLSHPSGRYWRDDARAPLELAYPATHSPTFGPRIHRG